MLKFDDNLKTFMSIFIVYTILEHDIRIINMVID